MYARPFTKCGPFIIGLLGGHLLSHPKSITNQMRFDSHTTIRLFLGGLIIASICVYGILPEYWHPERGNTFYNVGYTATFRTGFGAAIALMILALHFRY